MRYTHEYQHHNIWYDGRMYPDSHGDIRHHQTTPHGRLRNARHFCSVCIPCPSLSLCWLYPKGKSSFSGCHIQKLVAYGYFDDQVFFPIGNSIDGVEQEFVRRAAKPMAWNFSSRLAIDSLSHGGYLTTRVKFGLSETLWSEKNDMTTDGIRWIPKACLP